MSEHLIIYGFPGSQPARALFWACLLKELPFEMCTSKTSMFFTDGTNPRGQVPAMKDGDFCLSEMGAIACYLAEKHGWLDLYPEGLGIRARIQEFLHRYHSLFRLATNKLMAPFVVKPLGLRETLEKSHGDIAKAFFDNQYSIAIRDMHSISFATDNPLQEGGEAVKAIADFLEKFYFGKESPFVLGTDSPTLADLVCYSELGQLQIASLYDFAGFPKTARWLAAMAEVPHHDTIHAYNLSMGDLVTDPLNQERFVKARDAGHEALEQTGLVTVTIRD